MDSKLLEKFIEENFTNSALPVLMDYIRVPNLSPSYDPEWNTNGFQDKAAKILLDWVNNQNVVGLKAEIIKDSDKTPLIFVEISPTKTEETKNILMYGHFDKQPPFTGWKDGYGPTIPIIDGDLLYGRGSVDDGYAIFAAILSVKALQAQNLPHPKIIILLDGSEESGSIDLPSYVIKLTERIGKPNLIICLDSGVYDNKRLWITNALRGVAVFDLTVKCLTKGVHSGLGTGIAPESFMIMRKIISKIEENETGRIKDLEINIPEEIINSTKKAASVLGDEFLQHIPILPGVKFMSNDLSEMLLNNTWKPSLAIVGASGLPNISVAGNVLRPETKFRFSIRLPPTKDANEALKTIVTKLKENPPFKCSIIIENSESLDGWKWENLSDDLKLKINGYSKLYFNEDYCEAGVGGSIPFMNMLAVLYPESKFLVTGVSGYDNNAHGPNENLNLPYVKKFMCCISHLISDYNNFI